MQFSPGKKHQGIICNRQYISKIRGLSLALPGGFSFENSTRCDFIRHILYCIMAMGAAERGILCTRCPGRKHILYVSVYCGRNLRKNRAFSWYIDEVWVAKSPLSRRIAQNAVFATGGSATLNDERNRPPARGAQITVFA